MLPPVYARLVLSVFLLMVMPPGCDDEEPSPPSSADVADGSGDAGADGEVLDAGPEPWTGPYSELTIAGVNLITQEPMPGLEICGLDFPELGCEVTTEDFAAAKFTVPRRNQVFVLRDPDPSADAWTEEEAFVPVLLAIGLTENKATLKLAVPSLDGAMLGFASSLAQLTLRQDRAHISILVRVDGTEDSPFVGGASFTAECPNDGIYYVQGDFSMDPDAPGTGTEWGTAIIFNVDADECRVGIDHPERDCVIHNPGFSEDPEGPRFVSPPIAPGHLTPLQFRCPDPTP